MFAFDEERIRSSASNHDEEQGGGGTAWMY